MALRGRLTLLYTSLLGGILLLFGVAVYGAVSFTITAQVEDTLRHTVNNILADSRVDPVGELSDLWRSGCQIVLAKNAP